MKICIPSASSEGLNAPVYGHFGSTPFYTIYDTETKEVKVLSNQHNHTNHGSCQGLAKLSSYNIDAILTAGMGPNAVFKCSNMGIKVYVLEGKTVEEAVKNFEHGKIVELTYDMACSGHGQHHHGEHHHHHQ